MPADRLLVDDGVITNPGLLAAIVFTAVGSNVVVGGDVLVTVIIDCEGCSSVVVKVFFMIDVIAFSG